MWIIDQESWSSSDPALENVQAMPQTSKNLMNYDHIPSRPASNVLQDILDSFKSLAILPGGWSRVFLEDDELRALYRKHHWGSSFDAYRFEIDRQRLQSQNHCIYFAQEPLRKIENLSRYINGYTDRIASLHAELATVRTVDDKMTIKFRLFEQEPTQDLMVQKLEEARREAEDLCSDGVCGTKDSVALCELDNLRRQDTDSERLKQLIEAEMGETKSEKLEAAYRKPLATTDKQLIIVESALGAWEIEFYQNCDTQDCRVPPPRDEKDLARKQLETNKQIYVSQEEYVGKLVDWMDGLPEEAVNTREILNERIRGFKSSMDFLEEHNQRIEDYLAN